MRSTACIALLALTPFKLFAGQEVGEWNINAEVCAQSRLVFTADGQHESQMFEGGAWQTLAAAPYTRSGDLLIIENPAGKETLRIVEESPGLLVIQNIAAERQRAAGSERVELVRCENAG